MTTLLLAAALMLGQNPASTQFETRISRTTDAGETVLAAPKLLVSAGKTGEVTMDNGNPSLHLIVTAGTGETPHVAEVRMRSGQTMIMMPRLAFADGATAQASVEFQGGVYTVAVTGRSK